MRKYQIVFSIVLLISIGSFGSSFAQEDYFEYKQYIDTIRLMLNSSSEELSLISNTPDSEFLKETPIPEEILEEVSLLPLDEIGEHLSILTKELEPWTQMTPEEIENYKLKES
ncbi:MAG: hypothetical protein HRO68_06585 [Nitrosopumilus sp.]|nr:hypothetical protein [Nitrosopumilus sp.]